MAKNLLILLPCVLLLPSLIRAVHAVRYIVTNTVPNTPGGKLFDQEIGANFTILYMEIVNKFIWKILQQRTYADTKYVPIVKLYISDFDGYAYTNIYSDSINISGPALDKYYYPRHKSKFYFSTLLYREMTHVLQWSGNRTAPRGLTEGIADYVMVKSSIYEKDKYTKFGEGSRWDEGNGVTERFLEYCDSLRLGFTAELNKKMRFAYSDFYFVELLEKSVDQLWSEYKFKYGGLK